MAALKDVMVIDILDALNRRDDKMQKLLAGVEELEGFSVGIKMQVKKILGFFLGEKWFD
jgi:hypothetical protein